MKKVFVGMLAAILAASLCIGCGGSSGGSSGNPPDGDGEYDGFNFPVPPDADGGLRFEDDGLYLKFDDPAISSSRIFDPQTRAVVIVFVATGGKTYGPQIVPRRNGQAYFQGLTNPRRLTGFFRECADLAGTLFLNKDSEIVFPDAQARDTPWFAIKLGGSDSDYNTSISTARPIYVAGQSTGKQVVSDPSHPSAPDYDADISAVQGAQQRYYYVPPEDFSQPKTALIRIANLDGNVKLAALDSTGTLLISEVVMTSAGGVVTEDPGLNPLLLVNGLNKMTWQFEPDPTSGIIIAQDIFLKVEADDDAIAEFEMVIENAIDVGGEIG